MKEITYPLAAVLITMIVFLSVRDIARMDYELRARGVTTTTETRNPGILEGSVTVTHTEYK